MSSIAKNQTLSVTRASIYAGVVSLIGACLVIQTLGHLPDDTIGIAGFGIMAVLTELGGSMLVNSKNPNQISISFMIPIAALLCFGLPAAVFTQAVGGVAAILLTVLRRHPPQNSWETRLKQPVFHVGSAVISTYAAGIIYIFSGGQTSDLINLVNIIPLLFAVILQIVLHSANQIIVSAILASDHPFDIFRANLKYTIPSTLVSSIIGGGALAIAYELFGIFGAVVFFLPIVSTGYSFRLYEANMKGYIEKLEALNTTLNETNSGLLETMSEIIDAYDLYTYGHSTQVAVYASAIAEKMGLSIEEQERVVKASLMHDIGKIGVYDTIISKPGPLTEAEYSLMKQHPLIGAHILQRMKGLRDLIPLVVHHHERWDGKGYPEGLQAEQIPLGARILALADSVDAMCSDRPYRSTRSLPEVIEEVKSCSGAQFDPDVAGAFLELVGEKGSEYFQNSAAKVDRLIMARHIEKNEPQVSRFMKKSGVLVRRGE